LEQVVDAYFPFWGNEDNFETRQTEIEFDRSLENKSAEKNTQKFLPADLFEVR